MIWGSLVPQIFYDGIARVVAGAVCILTTAILWNEEIDTLLASLPHQGTFLVSMALLIGSYTIGIFLTGLAKFPGADIVFSSKSAKARAWDKVTAKFGRAFHCDEDFSKPAESIAIDAIRLRNPVAGARLVKLKAERALAKNLFVGTLIQFAVFVSFSQIRGPLSWVASFVFALIALAMILLARHLEARHATGLYNHWILVITNPELIEPDNDPAA